MVIAVFRFSCSDSFGDAVRVVVSLVSVGAVFVVEELGLNRVSAIRSHITLPRIIFC